jgi:Na+/pantothenate symporter
MIHQLFQKSDSSGSRSTILKPLTWLISLLIGGLLLTLSINPNSWLIFYFVSFITIALIAFFYVYFFCLYKNPDAIRSEKYSIQKMAIEKGIYGDNISGTFVVDSNKTLIGNNSITNNNDEKGTSE